MVEDKKVVLITGGSDGLGKALASNLKDSYKVIILSNNPEKIKRTAEELGVDFVVADVSNYLDIERVIDEIITKYGKIDYLINNAGIWIDGHIDTNSPEEIERVIDVNTKGTMFMTRSVLSSMKARKEGRIINVISSGGLCAKKDRSLYYASKWAITGFTKCLRIDLAPFNIIVSAFYPDVMNTSLFGRLGSGTRDVSGAMDPHEVAKVLRFMIETPDSLTIPELSVYPLVK